MNKTKNDLSAIERAYLSVFNQVFKEYRSAGFDESLAFDHAKFQADEFIRLTFGPLMLTWAWFGLRAVSVACTTND